MRALTAEEIAKTTAVGGSRADAEIVPVSGATKRRSAVAADVGALSATANESVARVRTAICEALGLIGSSISAARPKVAPYVATQPITADEAEHGETAPPTSGRPSKMAPAALGTAIGGLLRRYEAEGAEGAEVGSYGDLAAVVVQTATPAQEGGVSPVTEPAT